MKNVNFPCKSSKKRKIRYVEMDGERWLCLYDVLRELGYFDAKSGAMLINQSGVSALAYIVGNVRWITDIGELHLDTSSVGW